MPFPFLLPLPPLGDWEGDCASGRLEVPCGESDVGRGTVDGGDLRDVVVVGERRGSIEAEFLEALLLLLLLPLPLPSMLLPLLLLKPPGAGLAPN